MFFVIIGALAFAKTGFGGWAVDGGFFWFLGFRFGFDGEVGLVEAAVGDVCGSSCRESEGAESLETGERGGFHRDVVFTCAK